MTSTGRPPSPSPRRPAGALPPGVGEEADGYTLNGSSPGPTLRVPQGGLLEVRLVNESVAGGPPCTGTGSPCRTRTTAAGVTQDAVPGAPTSTAPAPHAGTYWYHAPALHEQVERGMLGALVVDPPGAAVDQTIDRRRRPHPLAGRRTVAGRTGDVAVPAAGTPVRLRVINTDNGPLRTWVDGAVPGPRGRRHGRPRARAGGRHVGRRDGGARVDLEVVAPARGDDRRLVGWPPAGSGSACVAAARGRAGPAALRHSRPAGVRPGDRCPHLRVRDRPPPRFPWTGARGCGGR